MIYAYGETYLNDAMNNLGDMFDYAVNDCGYKLEEFFDYFTISGIATAFEKGNPKYVAGLSGVELASEVIFRTFGTRLDVLPSANIDRSPEYWVGWILAYYQWYTVRRFYDMKGNGLTVTRVLSLYPTLHEADVSKFVLVANQIIEKNVTSRRSNLQRIRKTSGMTQRQLSESSGVSLRMIQLYEQRQQEINKAQAVTLIRMAYILGCDVEDLFENSIAES